MKYDASGAEAHVRFIMKVMLVQRCANKTQLKLKVRENEKIAFLADNTFVCVPSLLSAAFYFMVNVKLWHVLWHYSDHVYEPNLKNKDNENKAGAASLYFTKKTECYGKLWHTIKSLTNILLFL